MAGTGALLAAKVCASTRLTTPKLALLVPSIIYASTITRFDSGRAHQGGTAKTCSLGVSSLYTIPCIHKAPSGCESKHNCKMVAVVAGHCMEVRNAVVVYGICYGALYCCRIFVSDTAPNTFLTHSLFFGAALGVLLSRVLKLPRSTTVILIVACGFGTCVLAASRAYMLFVVHVVVNIML